jgi:uncharacterized protein (TIGR03067 family)
LRDSRGCVAAGSIHADETAAELKKFAGTWKVTSGSADGNPLPAEALLNGRILFDGDRFTFKGGPAEAATTFSVDTSRQTIEIAPPKGETRILRGRYRFDGAKLTLCLTDADKVPETILGGKDRLVLVLERER